MKYTKVRPNTNEGILIKINIIPLIALFNTLYLFKANNIPKGIEMQTLNK